MPLLAIVEQSQTQDDQSGREHFYRDRQIRPIWFRNGDYGAVETLLAELAVQSP